MECNFKQKMGARKLILINISRKVYLIYKKEYHVRMAWWLACLPLML